jgi:putative PIN family toxin of toxin-antitoxin system
VKVVVDTRVLVSALYGGISRRIIELLDNGAFTLCVSKYIVAEYIRVLQHVGADRSLLEQIAQFCAEADSVIDTHATRRFDVGEITPTYKFLECAFLAKADYIVTDDPMHFEIEQHDGIQIVTPREFVELAEHAKRKK